MATSTVSQLPANKPMPSNLVVDGGNGLQAE
jgi:hypothetical protein